MHCGILDEILEQKKDMSGKIGEIQNVWGLVNKVLLLVSLV